MKKTFFMLIALVAIGSVLVSCEPDTPKKPHETYYDAPARR